MGGKFKFSAQYSELGVSMVLNFWIINRKKILVVPDDFFFSFLISKTIDVRK